MSLDVPMKFKALEHDYPLVHDKIKTTVLKILTALDEPDKVLSFFPWELAQIQIDLIQKQKVNKSDWNSVKNGVIQGVRKSYLEDIVKGKIQEKENLLPPEKMALEDKFTAADVTEYNRYDIYLEFLSHRLHELIETLRKEVYERDGDSLLRRQDQICEFHKWWSDRLLILEGSNDDKWDVVNEAWQIYNTDSNESEFQKNLDWRITR